MGGTYYRHGGTGVVAVFGPAFTTATTVGRTEFTTAASYHAWRDALVADPREIAIPPADPADIVGLAPAGWAIVCRMYGGQI